jgi:hypothetical protein
MTKWSVGDKAVAKRNVTHGEFCKIPWCPDKHVSVEHRKIYVVQGISTVPLHKDKYAGALILQFGQEKTGRTGQVWWLANDFEKLVAADEEFIQSIRNPTPVLEDA